MPQLKIYDASEVTCVFAGLPLDSGFGDGEFIRIEQAEDDFATVVGTDGEVTRSKTNNTLCTVTITLGQTSDGNTKLTTVHNLDKKGNNGAGVGPLLIKDRSGLALHMFGKAWIAAPPTVVYGKQAEGREWKLQAMITKRFDGGTSGI